MDKILKKYSVIGDDLFYHHTLNEPTGDFYYSATEVHRQYEVLYLISGRISYVIEGQSYDAEAGDVIFVAPDEIHTIRIDGRHPYERAVILFDVDIIHNMLAKLNANLSQFSGKKNRTRIIKKEIADRYGLPEALLSIIELNESEKYQKLGIVSRLIEFMVRIDKIAEADSEENTPPTSEDELVRSAIAYIDEHIKEKISLDSLAASLFVSKSTLCHRFSAYLKITPNRYITVRKMHLAQRLIREGLSVTNAASAVGYDNYSAFYYNYRQIIGKAPTGMKNSL